MSTTKNKKRKNKRKVKTTTKRYTKPMYDDPNHGMSYTYPSPLREILAAILIGFFLYLLSK